MGPTATPGFRPNAPRAASPGGRPRGRAAAHRCTERPASWAAGPDGARNTRGAHSNTGIQAERPASSVARWTPLRPASCAAWVRHEKPSARYTASGWADRDGSSECEATATDRS